MKGKEQLLATEPRMGQRDVWACCLTFLEGESNNIHGSWFMVDAEISGGGGRGSGRPKTPGRPAPRPTNIDLPVIELSQAFGHGRYRYGAADWVEMRRIGRFSISDGILVDRCFRICMSEAGTHQSSLGSQQIRKGTIPQGRLMCTLGSIKQRSSGPSCAHAEGMHRSHVLPHSYAAFRPTARLPTVSAFSFINSDRRSPTCTMLVLLCRY